MKQAVHDHWEFVRQFRKRFETTGAILPSSRLLSQTLTEPLQRAKRPLRILEVGPGTGAVTRHIVPFLTAEDRLDLVEVNERFVDLLRQRFRHDPVFRPAADRCRVYHCPLQEFSGPDSYEVIISGLPLNNFSPPTVGEIFECFFQSLSEGGVLSYFEYMYLRSLRRLTAGREQKARLKALDDLLQPYLEQYGVARRRVWLNVPPAWVHYLKKEKRF